MKANAKARRQAVAAAVKEAKATGLAAALEQSAGAAAKPAKASPAIKDRADDYLLSKALIGDGDLPSWLKD